MYKKKLWKPILAGTLAFAMALTPAVSGKHISAAEPEEMTTEAGSEEITTEETEEAAQGLIVSEEEVDTASDISLTEEYFPDANFRKYISDNIDTDKDGVLSQSERDDCTIIKIDNGNCKDLTGIQYFVRLKELYCASNQLTSLDVSKNTQLTSLDCCFNQLTSLDVSQNTGLTSLRCDWNQLTSLDVSRNTQLTILRCGANKFTSLNVSNNTKLETLYCYETQLTSLDISRNTRLTELVCRDNQLTSLDVSQNKQLTILCCYNNQLTSLDVSKNIQLIDLDCNLNQLTSLDVSKNTQLTSLAGGSNQLSRLDVNKNTKLERLYCYNNLLTGLDVSHNTQLTELRCSDNQLTSLDVSKNTKLEILYCYNNQLASLDVSQNTQLMFLCCYNNQLTSLDVSKNLQLMDLDCNTNRLTSLDVSKNIQLMDLDCNTNRLTSLDVSNNAQLMGLSCGGNKLACLDLTKNTKIRKFRVSDNEYPAILNSKRQIDLTTIPGFQVSQVSNVSGGTITGTVLTFKSGVDKVTYTYDCGDGHSATFAIKETEGQNLTKDFCARLYTLCLGRSADEAGVNYWTAQLNNKKVTGAQVGYSFVFSDEYKKKNTSDKAYVKMLYKVFMDRSADQGGLNYWLDLLNQGMSREYVYKGFAESKEFTNICASYGIERGSVKLTQARDQNVNLTKFVNRIYVKAMNRKGDEKGLNYWCSQIQSKKMTPVQVAESFIYSKEFTDKNLSNTEYIKVLYRTFMGREADTAGLNYWVGRLNKGESRKTVLKAFAGCQEFKNIVKSFGL